MKKVSKGDLPLLWAKMAGGATLYLPIEEDGVVDFAPWREGAAVNLEWLSTMQPPKRVVFPQSEAYFRFESDDGKLELREVQGPGSDYILFGVKPCDAAGLAVLDKVFLEDPEDGLYAARRGGLVISMACNAPDQACFCTVFGLEPGMAPGADIMLWDLGDTIVWQAQTDRGRALTDSVNGVLEDATATDARKAEELRQKASAEVADGARERHWGVDGVSERLNDMFDSPVWEKLYRRCLGCGICTYLCPTCHCFDVEDFSRGQAGERFRCWDTCMAGDFTLMASGENPRPSQKERVRQRFMHKLNYIPSRQNGLYGCVGCGRCVRRCPVSLDITQVIKEVGGVVSGR